ncbi:LacI family DNA-binding transcriptional regulator [Sinomonas sp. JGH33]|uniref:LacI family DNA-binding transcriptional regulator n=1 Tax=Sinomonas terricola TaxID=3110330 RepID=A0ABU5T3F5_9MICC|nr:LacI family DNA-binding transcriptional regulator [Sinomonas sp. JGH33]MEA5454034.1 LacI family DNA-binding transcriptional regulator [Sinomonas sp. JGH33]
MPTSKDVARLAGVSQSTVSYVMSGRRPISEKTRKRVEAAMAQLAFQPNAGARALASRRSQVIGLAIPFVPDLHMGSIMEFISVIAATARQSDYDILLVTDDEGPQGLERVVGQQLVDGLIIMQVEGDDARVPVIRNLPVPSVLIGIPEKHDGLECIDADFELAGAMCVEELAQLGHESVILVDWQDSVVRRHVNYVKRFHRGVDKAAAAVGLKVIHAPGRTTIAAMEKAVTKALEQTNGIPAFIAPEAANQDLLVEALHNLGLVLGEDASVVVNCSDRIAERQRTPLTTIGFEPDEVSRRAVHRIVRDLTDPTSRPHEALELIRPVLKRRKSTIRPRNKR